MEDNFDGRWPSMEDDLVWKTIFNDLQSLEEKQSFWTEGFLR